MDKPFIQLANTTERGHLEQIVALQKKNLKAALSVEDANQQGFVTVVHDVGLLSVMGDPSGHIVALDQDMVVGYALCMHNHARDLIQVLIPMFDEIDRQNLAGRSLQETPYVVMGQLCIDKPYRGMGLVKRLYAYMKSHLQADYKWIITEVSTANPRSLRVHEKCGFKPLKTYTDPAGETWSIIYTSTRY